MLPAPADVLVLGAGLAGLRAALSCLLADPSHRVRVASLRGGPTGSSFANINNALGFHACRTDRDREDYVREVAALNRGARLSLELLRIQAQEGAARLADLEDMGAPFVRDAGGGLLAHSSCFSPHSRRAFVFTPLAPVYEAFRTRLEALGCSFAHGLLPVALIGGGGRSGPPGEAHGETTDGRGLPRSPSCASEEAGRTPDASPTPGTPEAEASRVRGAVFVPVGGGAPVAVAASAVIVALGGPGRLFAHSMAGPANPGYGQGLLARSGAAMANLGYLQYMWATVPGLAFWQPAETGRGGWRIGGKEGALLEEAVPNLAELAPLRAGHCPYGHGLEDSAIDLALASALDDSGIVRLARPDGGTLAVAPSAHASNGGAVIDAHGRTSVPGLFAVGECATGMHGSNRLGGGMVLATQVFGHRAGVAAALEAKALGEPACPGDTAKEAAAGIATDEGERSEGLAWLAGGLSFHAVLGGRPGAAEHAREVRERREIARDWHLRLALDTASGILENLPGSPS